MQAEIRAPASLGESVLEATVGKWLKEIGDPIAVGDAVVELETDKVNMEVYAEDAGTLAAIAKPVGAVIGVGEVLGSLSAAGVGVAAATAHNGGTAVRPAASAPAEAAPVRDTRPATSAHDGGTVHDTAIVATPVARRIAAEHQIDLAAVQGSGPGGRIMKQDIASLTPAAPDTSVPHPAVIPGAPSQAAPAPRVVVASASEPAAMVAPGREQRQRMSRRRLTIARRLVEAQRTAAMLTTFNEVDMGAIIDVRKRRKDSFKERHGVGLGFMSFFTKAVVGALKAFPRLNAEIQGDEIVLKNYYDIGIAVGVEDGLVVPVVRDANRKSFAEIEREIAELATRARSNALTLPELQGGTFTITNGGIFGSLLSTPILNIPQVGILGMHKIEERPIAMAGQVVIRPMMYLALSYDHRIVDGNEAVRFLVRCKELLEDPETLLLEG